MACWAKSQGSKFYCHIIMDRTRRLTVMEMNTRLSKKRQLNNWREGVWNSKSVLKSESINIINEDQQSRQLTKSLKLSIMKIIDKWNWVKKKNVSRISSKSGDFQASNTSTKKQIVKLKRSETSFKEQTCARRVIRSLT